MTTPEPITIDKKIVGHRVKEAGTDTPSPAPAIISEPTIHDVPLMERPDVLRGKTYKIKPGEHAMYITINDALFYEGTAREQYAPYEIFVNTKDTVNAHHYAVVTRLISSLFRRGGDVRFIVEEMNSIIDPKGGYWSSGRYIQSAHQEIGMIVHAHIKALSAENEHRQQSLQNGMIPMETPVPHKAPHKNTEVQVSVHGTLCGSCKEYSVVIRDGCPTCISCGAGKCS